MTAILNNVINQHISSSAFGAISTYLGLIAVVLLLLLLIERVLLDAYIGERLGKRLRVFNIATLPLLIAFAVIVIMRFIQILQTL
jgi:hypothetical protein